MLRRLRPHGLNVWVAAAGVAALLVVAPLMALGVEAMRGSTGLWTHLFQYVLPDALRDTALLLTGVGLLAGIIGAGAAWVVSAYDYPGRRVMEWALLLPLAMPTYVIAYAYLDLLHPVGIVQTSLRWVLGIDSPRDFRLPEIRSMAGCVLLLSSVLYPYVYLTCRALFAAQDASCFDAARTLGVRRRGLFWRVALPLARPAIVVGVTLVMLEALNDIGASEFLGVRTLTVSIYSTWVTRSDLPGAAQMALAMLAIVSGLGLVEWYARRGRQYVNQIRQARPFTPTRLQGWRAACAFGVTSLPILVGFVFPTTYLVSATLERLAEAPVSGVLVTETMTTMGIAAVATVVTTVVGAMVAYGRFVRRGTLTGIFTRVSSFGYAVPGTVLAIGVLPVLSAVDSGVERGGRMIGASWIIFTLGTGAGLIYACV